MNEAAPRPPVPPDESRGQVLRLPVARGRVGVRLAVVALAVVVIVVAELWAAADGVWLVVPAALAIFGLRMLRTERDRRHRLQELRERRRR